MADSLRKTKPEGRVDLKLVWISFLFVFIHWTLVIVWPAAYPADAMRTWGFDFITLFPEWLPVAYFIVVLAAIPSMNRFALSGVDTIDRWLGHPRLTRNSLGLGAFVAVVLFWGMRQKYPLLGDGYAWVDGLTSNKFDLVGGVNLLWKSYQYTLRQIYLVSGLEPEFVVSASSCLHGAAYVVLAALLAKDFGKIDSTGRLSSGRFSPQVSFNFTSGMGKITQGSPWFCSH